MLRRGLVFAAVLAGLWALWEAYRAFGVAVSLAWPFEVNERTMPHIHDMIGQLFEPSRRNGPLLIEVLGKAALFTAKEAAVGFALGAGVGFLIAVALVHSTLLQRGFLPYIVASQTIPILAIAPMVVVWLGGRGLPGWFSVSVIAAYLTFFPVAINALRGLQSADPRAHELMNSYAASRWTVLWKLRVPASLPYLFAAFKIAATACVVGAIIGELPASIQDGLGGAILNFNQYYASSPESLWATNIIAALLGIAFFLLIVLTEKLVVRRAPGAFRMNEQAAVVSLKSLTKDFARGGVRALQEIDLEVRPREFVSLIGPSGCGKSTLLRIIGDLVPPTSGEVVVNGKQAHQARLDRDYGIVFQDAVLYDWRTVAKNIALPLEMLDWDRARRSERIGEMVELVELAGFEDHYPWQLSGGMQQRVSIARALSFDPPLLLMDEPFGALDEMTRERMNMELLRIWQESGSTIVFVTHSIAEAVFLSTRVVVLSPRPARITGIVDIDLPQPRNTDTREQERFFELVTQVRELLRTGDRSGEELPA